MIIRGERVILGMIVSGLHTHDGRTKIFQGEVLSVYDGNDELSKELEIEGHSYNIRNIHEIKVL